VSMLHCLDSCVGGSFAGGGGGIDMLRAFVV
jgi:hypothetical protein